MSYQIRNAWGLFLQVLPSGAIKWGCPAMGAHFSRAEALATARKYRARAVRLFTYEYRAQAPDGTARSGRAPFYGVSMVETQKAFTAAMLREGFTNIRFEVTK